MTVEMKFCVVCGKYVEPAHGHEMDAKVPTNFTFEYGRKNKHGQDIVLLWNGFKVSMIELGLACGFLYRNEERIYPPSKGFEGGKRFKRFIDDCMDTGFPTRDLRRKYLL